MALGVALLGAALAWIAGRLWFGRWAAACFAVLIVGHAGALRWVEAGPVVGYSHARLDLLAGDPVALAALALEVVVAALGLWRVRERARALIARLGPARLALAALVLLAFAASPSADPVVYATEAVVAFGVQTLHLLTLAAGILAIPEAARQRVADWGGRTWFAPSGGTPRVDRFVLVVGLCALSITLALSIFAYERHPHVPDEVSYLLHARYLATGALEMAPPPVPEAFQVDLMTIEPSRWYSPVPFGWPAVLAIGAAAGAAWLVNPALVFVCVLLGYLLTWELYGRRVARICSLLLASSPWLLFLGMSFMSHLSSLALALGAGLATARWYRGRHPAWMVVAGGAVGWLGLTRPLEAVIAGLCVGVAVLVAGRARRRVPALALLAVGAIAVGSLVFPYNERFTGSPLEFPINDYVDSRYGEGSNALGFGSTQGLGWSNLDPYPGHDLRDAVINTVVNTAAVDDETFGWPTGSLLAVIALFLFRGPERRDWWIAATLVPLVGLHAIYYFSGGPDFGARYWFLAIFPLAALAARAVGDPGREPRLAVAAGVLSLSALTVFVPWRAADKYHEYRGMTPELGELVQQAEVGRAVVLVRGQPHPDYASAAVFNPIDFAAADRDTGDRPLFAYEYGPEARARLEAAFPDRPIYVVEGPSVTGDGYRFVERPRAP